MVFSFDNSPEEFWKLHIKSSRPLPSVIRKPVKGFPGQWDPGVQQNRGCHLPDPTASPRLRTSGGGRGAASETCRQGSGTCPATRYSAPILYLAAAQTAAASITEGSAQPVAAPTPEAQPCRARGPHERGRAGHPDPPLRGTSLSLGSGWADPLPGHRGHVSRPGQ